MTKIDLNDPGVELVPDEKKPNTFTLVKHGMPCTCSFKQPLVGHSDMDVHQKGIPVVVPLPCQSDCANFRTLVQKEQVDGHKGTQDKLKVLLGCGAGTSYTVKKVWELDEYQKQKKQSKIHTIGHGKKN